LRHQWPSWNRPLVPVPANHIRDWRRGRADI